MEEEYVSRIITYEDYKSIETTLLLKNNTTNPSGLRQRIEDFLEEYHTKVPENCYSSILPLKPKLNGNSEIYIRIKYHPNIEDKYITGIILKKLKKEFRRELKSLKIKKSRQTISCLL